VCPLQALAHGRTVVRKAVGGGLEHDRPNATTCGGLGTQHQMSGDDLTPAVTTETMNLRISAIRPFGTEVCLPNFQVALSRIFLE
jgi:hypothetical protein